jgi:bifunctional UDP-N-acetylglucosamine pyrophosphorylase / glucosamine-1-phosphate N-acetyltransferase
MTRTMVIPAAGSGSRLGAPVPKVLAHVAGRPMIDHLLDLYGPAVQRFVVVVSPAGRDLVASHVRTRTEEIALEVQLEPTGMLDAILLARDAVQRHRPDRVWITWCDQLAVGQETVDRLKEAEATDPEPALVMPTCPGPDPYIHFDRDGSGQIVAVRQRREGDAMPPVGESDMGLFSLARAAYLEDLEAFNQAAGQGQSTRERNFLPFVPWLARSRRVLTFPCADPIEAVGINTPEELRRIEAHLGDRAQRRARGDIRVSGG